jgi:hypothetical protein
MDRYGDQRPVESIGQQSRLGRPSQWNHDVDALRRIPAATQTVSFAYGQLSNGVNYDFALAYVNTGGVIGSITPFATNFSAATFSIPGAYLTHSTWTPTATSVTFTPAPSVSGITAVVAFSFTITNQPTDGSLGTINLYFKPHSQSVWTPAFGFSAQSGTSATYTGQISDLTVGQLYDFGVAGESISGLYTTAVTTLATSVNPGSVTIPNPYLQGNVAAAAPTFSGTPTCTPSSSVNGLAADVAIALTTSNQPTDGSLSRLNFWYRNNTVTSPSTSAGWSCAGGLPSGGVGLASPAASYAYVFNFNDLTNGTQYWFGVSYEDNQGNETRITTITGSPITAQTVGIPSAYLLSTAWTPTFTSATFTPAASVTGVTATVAFSFTVTNQPTDGSLGTINIWFKPHSQTVWTPYFGLSAQSGASATYTGQISDLTVGQAYDFGFSGQSISGVYETSVVTLTGSGGVNPGSVSIPAPYMLGGATGLTPTFSSLSESAVTSSNGIAAAVNVNFTITNLPTNGSLSRINFWYRLNSLTNSVNTIGATNFHWHSASGILAPSVGSASPPSSAAFNPVFDVTPGIGYDFGASFEDNQGGESNVGVIYLNVVTNITGIPNQYLTANATYTPSITGGIAAAPITPPPTGIGNYPSVTPVTQTATSNNGLTAAWTVSFSINNQPTDGSLSRVSLFYRNQTTSPWSFYASVPAYGVASGVGNLPAIGYYSTTLEDLGNGIAWSFGVSCEDMTGNETIIVSIATATSAVPVSPGGLLGGQNAIVDSGYLASTYVSRNSASNPYWYFYNIANPYQNLWQNDGSNGNSLQVRSEASGVRLYGISQPIQVEAGQAYTISFLCDARGCNTNAPFIGIVNTTGNNTYSTVYAQANGTLGSLARVSTTWTCPTTGGPTEVSVVVSSNMCHVPAGYTLFMYQPMFQEGSSLTGYVLGPSTAGASVPSGNLIFNPTAAQNTLGWLQSAGMTKPSVTFTRDTYQGGRFLVEIAAGSGYIGSYAEYYQQISGLQSGQVYSLSGLISTGTLNTGGYAYAYMYDENTSTIVAQSPQFTTAQSAGNPFNLTFTATSDTYDVVIQGNAASTSPTTATVVGFGSLQLEQNPTSTAYADNQAAGMVSSTHQPTPGAEGNNLANNVINARHLIGTSGTTITSSQILRAQQSSLAIASNFTIYCAAQASATSYGNYGSPLAAAYGSIWFGWPAWGSTYPDSSVLSYVAFPGSFNSSTVATIISTGQASRVTGDGVTGALTAMQSSTSVTTTLYVTVYQPSYNDSSLTTVFYTAALTYQQAALYWADGCQTLVSNIAITMPIRPSSGSTNASSAPVVPPNTCPAVGQVVMTKRGPVLAEDLHLSDELLDWDNGTYNKITKLRRQPAIIWEVVVAGKGFKETLLVDENHKFATPLGWWNVKHLVRGDEVVNANGGIMNIDSCRSVGMGEFVAISCDKRRFRIGSSVGHNVPTGIHN